MALESTIISTGCRGPRTWRQPSQFEALLTASGVTPATIALIDGVPKAGLSAADLERVALDESAVKVSSRDLGLAMAAKRTGGTTVAATSVLAARAGLRVFATGGLGGVHRGYGESFNESADLTVLSRTAITVVSAGVKSILDIPATLERLETLGVAVVGYRTSRFPAFYLTDSGQDLDWRVDSAGEVAAAMAARDAVGDTSALLVGNRCRSTSSSTPVCMTACWPSPCRRRGGRDSRQGGDPVPARLHAAGHRRREHGGQPRCGPRQHRPGGRDRHRLVGACRAVTRAVAQRRPGRSPSPGPRHRGCHQRHPGGDSRAARGRRGQRGADQVRPGGSAANQAAWMGHLGLDVVFAERVGEADAELHKAELSRFGVAPHLAADESVGTGSVVVLVGAASGR